MSVAVSAELRHLIDSAAPYWAGEVEVFRSYWNWDRRSRESDRRWIALPGEPKLNPHAVNTAWQEDLELSALRFAHKKENPRLGERATRFTEGGYCTLFSEGMKLKGSTHGPHGRANGLIAEACSRVYEDEFGHMLKGVAGLDAEGLSAADWGTLERMALEQLRGRIRMRNAQFGNPLAGAALERSLSGGCAPIAFDYVKAGSRLAA